MLLHGKDRSLQADLISQNLAPVPRAKPGQRECIDTGKINLSPRQGNAVLQTDTMPDPYLNVQKLKRSARYRVRRAFTDYYHNLCREGETLTFIGYHFLPYHGGYTLQFEERTIYLQEELNAAILDSLANYLEPIRE